MAPSEEFAPAKINLTLHVTGRRADGYHTLDSLVVFADVGDRITAAPAEKATLHVTGPRAAGVPTGADNLILKAASLAGVTAALTLEKHLPAASGIGGGSSDAAATLRALHRLGAKLPPPEAVLSLGADVPVCLGGAATRMSGIGENLAPVETLPPLPAVLVNPGVEVPTGAVFRALERTENAPMEGIPDTLPDPGAAAEWLAIQRNDLEAPARTVAPAIGAVLSELQAQSGCLLSRMSGSGATCFGLFPTASAARSAAARLAGLHPDWWITPTTLS